MAPVHQGAFETRKTYPSNIDSYQLGTDLGFRGGTCLGTTLMRFGDSSFGFGGWDKGTWGLGVGLGDNLYEIWGQLFRLWGLGQGDLGFRGGTGGQPI